MNSLRVDRFSIFNNSWVILMFFFLPFNYALTINIGFPLKVSEICLFIILGLAVFFKSSKLYKIENSQIYRVILYFFITVSVSVFVNALWQYDYPFKSFDYRLHPRFDSILKYFYFLLNIAILIITSNAFKKDQEKFLKWWMYGSVIAALYSWYLFLGSLLSFDLFYLPGMDTNPQSISLSFGNIIRCGTFKEGNYMGVYLLICYIVAKYSRTPLLSTFFFLSILTTFSSIAIVSAAFFYFITTFKRNFTKSRVHILLAILVFFIISIGVALQNKDLKLIVVNKLTADTDEVSKDSYSKIDRVNSINVSLQQVYANPLLGVGLSNYGLHFDQYNTHRFFTYKNFKPIPNNVYFEVLCETGILGTIFFLFFILLLLKKANSDRSKILKTGIYSLLICFIAFPTFSVFFIWVYFGLILSLSNETKISS